MGISAKTIGLIAAMWWTIGAPSPSRATVVVDWNGGGDYTTIQAALDATSNGEEIVVMPSTGSPQGAYVENLSFPLKDLTLRSTAPSSPAVVAATVIDGNAAGSVVDFALDVTSNAVLDGFTVRNGSALAGGGIRCTNGDPKIRRCVVTQNTAEDGGGIRVWNGSPLIEGCTISDNTATSQGGGISCMGYAAGPKPTILRCVISGNSVDGDWVYGGGVHCSGIDVDITSCGISGNTAGSAGQSGAAGGGVYSTDGTLTVTDCTVSGNTATAGQSYGGGIRSLWGTLAVSGGEFWGNSAVATDYSGGGGISSDGDLTVSGALITGNSANGGFSFFDGGGGIQAQCGTAIITDCTIVDNDATASGGGVHGIGTYCTSGHSTELRNCTIAGNDAAGGAGIMSYGGSLDVRDCAITWNEATGDGGGIHVDTSVATVIGCTIAHNSASPDFGGGGEIASWSSQLTLTNDILWGGTGVFGAELMVDRWEVTDTSWATVSYCDVAGGEAGVYVGDGSTLTWGDGNLEVDPQFVDIDGLDGDSSTWADNDFHLAGASP
ncbi:MAG: DUF1565 domain-containing protein, partial [bacterium]|nr:DUF1565 domain-containing protein [bacterium]